MSVTDIPNVDEIGDSPESAGSDNAQRPEETTLARASGKSPLPDGKVNEKMKAVLG